MSREFVDVALVRQQAGATWAQDSGLRAEFNGNRDSYVAYAVAEANGLTSSTRQNVYGGPLGERLAPATSTTRAPIADDLPRALASPTAQSSKFRDLMRKQIIKRHMEGSASLNAWLAADEPGQAHLQPMSRRDYFASIGLVIDDDGRIAGS